MTMAPPDLVLGLAAPDAAEVLGLGTLLELSPGGVLFRLGDPAESVYLIQRGRISLTLPMQLAGREQDVVVEEHQPGHTLGWSALIPPHRFTLTATAPLATSVLAFRRSALMEFCAANPRVGYALALNIAAVVGQRLQVFQAMWLREMQRAVNNAHV
jgi:CRP/FNR family transcriptional regulator, cyclic AMP receptor protein